MTLTLESITDKAVSSPPRILLHAPNKLGKTTFGSNAPKSLLVDLENGAERITTPKTPCVEDFAELMSFLQTHILSGQHDYKTLVIDPLDTLEQLIQRHVMKANSIQSMMELGFGEAYTQATNHWRTFLQTLEQIRKRRQMIIILTCHTAVRQINLPDQEVFDSYMPNLREKDLGLIKDWVDFILFANLKYELTEEKSGFQKIIRGVGEPRRVLYTTPQASHLAGQREQGTKLPAELDFTWKAFAQALKAARAEKKVSDDDQQ